MPSSGSIRSPLPESRNVDGLVEHDEHRFEAAENAIAAPVLRQLDGGPLEVAAILLELRLEAREQRKGIGRGAGKPREDAIVVEAPDFLRLLLHDGLAERHLTVAGQHGAVVMANGEDRGAVKHRIF